MKQTIDSGAVIYCRVSTSEQVHGFSLKLQERLCREYCIKNGYEILGLFVDEGRSARTIDRPEFLKAINFCQRNREKVSFFVVYRLDRFSRSQVDHYSIKTSLRKLGVRVVSATQEVNESQPESILIEGIAAAVGEYESRIIGLRAKTGMEEARRNGRLSNCAPIGYLNTRVKGIGNTVIPDEDLAPYVREAFELYASGSHSKSEVVTILNEKGYRSHRGKQLSQQQLQKMLANRTYAGYVLVNETEGWTRAIFEPLVSESLFNRAQDRLRRERRAQSKPHSRAREEFPLRGLLLCSECGRPLTASLSRGKSGKRFGYYRCFNKYCNGVSVRKEAIEEEFVSLLSSLIPSVEFSRTYIDASYQAHADRKEKVDSELEDYITLKDSLRLRRQKLIEMYLDEKVAHGIFQETLELLEGDLQDVAYEIRLLTENELNLDNIICRAVHCLENAANLWIQGNLRSRREFQMTLFPAGLTYSKSDGFGTPPNPTGFDFLELRNTPLKQVAGGQGFEPR